MTHFDQHPRPRFARRPGPREPRRPLALVALAALAAYALVTLSFVLPPGEARQALSGVNRAASPFFAQKWNIFAPQIARTNPRLEIQAQWTGPDGRPVLGEWIELTAIELRSVEGNPLPSKIQKNSWSALTGYTERYRRLSEDQRATVRGSLLESEAPGAPAMSSDRLVERLAAEGARGPAIAFLRYDYMIGRNAAYVAAAATGETPERVRWRVLRSRPNDFADRRDPETHYADTRLSFGWRRVMIPVVPEVVADYRDVLERYGPGSAR